jgi:glyoxylase-like metal-dependent hydrolase (beta-lactamase superfamily II)
MKKHESIYPDIYRINVPLPGNPLKSINSYLILGSGRNLLVDTGFNLPITEETISAALRELESPLEKTDIFITHAHVDHSGLACKLKRAGNAVFFPEGDVKYLDAAIQGSILESRSCERFNIPAEKGTDHKNSVFNLYGPENTGCFTLIKEPYAIPVGGYLFEIIDIPGHTPGQVGLYERNHKLFFSGDHILEAISPNLTTWGGERDYVEAFMQSLEKVGNMDIGRVFPGHGGTISDHRARIKQLIKHHERRLDEVLKAVADGFETVYEIGAHIKWDYKSGKIEDFSPEQLWFAASETYAHAEHLRFAGLAALEQRGGLYRYTLA